MDDGGEKWITDIRMRNCNPHILLVGMQNGIVTSDNSPAVS